MSELRFGVILNDFVLKKWQIVAIQNLLNSGLKCELIILPQHEASKNEVYKRNIRRNLFYRLYQRFLLNVPLLDNQNAEELFFDCEKIRVEPIAESQYADRFHESDVEYVRQKKLDFILRFGFNIIHGDILNAAKYGIWSFHHDDDEVIRGGPPGFWEIFLNKDLNGIVLQRLTNELDKGYIIKKSLVPVISHSYSTHLNELLQQGLNMLDFAVENLKIHQKINIQSPNNIKGKLYKFPQNSEMVRFLIILLKNKIQFHYNDLFKHEKWEIAISKQSVGNVFKTHQLIPETWLPPMLNRYFAADPFILDLSENRSLLFFEKFDYKQYKGEISGIFLSEKDEFKNSYTIIEPTTHFSFPHCELKDDKFELIPENCISRQVTKFIFDKDMKLLHQEIIFDKDAVDAVFFKFENTEWLFCGLKYYNPNNYLFLFYKDDSGNYLSHPQNPVVSNASRSRMAGKIIEFEGNIFRPSQKNNLWYGEKIIINRILKLTKEEYLEDIEFMIDTPFNSKNSKGIHTINFTNNRMVFDAKREIFSRYQFVRNLKRKLKIV